MSTEGTSDHNAAAKIDSLLNELRVEISNLSGKENSHASRVQSLEDDLNAYKSLCTELRAERDKYKNLFSTSEKDRGDLENSIKGNRIVALLDGDGVIFQQQYILGGRYGGQEAAQTLSNEIIQYLKANFGAKPYQLWVKIFLNKRGLVEAYKRFGNVNEGLIETKFEEFMSGFNQAAERFSVVDVGAIKEAADAKIKAHLEDDLKIPQTEKVIFGGCHDTGYINSLRSHITSGFREKLILLPGYEEMAFGIGDLGLPTMPPLPNLFLSQKLGSPLGYSNGGTFNPPRSPRKNRVNNVQSGNANTFASRSISPVSQLGTPVANLVSLDGTATGSKNGGANTSGELRHPDPKLSLFKQSPPPCTRFYVSGICKYGAKCIYAHNYILDPSQLAEIRKKAKINPCDSIVKKYPCSMGDACPFGHYCPQGAKCFYLKKGNCRFGGAAGHRLAEAQPEAPQANVA